MISAISLAAFFWRASFSLFGMTPSHTRRPEVSRLVSLCSRKAPPHGFRWLDFCDVVHQAFRCGERLQGLSY